VRAGLYDADGDGARLPLVGGDATGRVPVGVIVPRGDGFAFFRTPPAASQSAGRVGVRPRAMVRKPPVEPSVCFGEEDLTTWRVEGLDGGTASLERTREQLCWSEASLRVTYSGASAASGFALRPPRPLPAARDADVAYLWIFGNALGWAEVAGAEQPFLSCALEMRDAKGRARRLPFPVAVNCPFWYVHRVRLPADWPRPLSFTGLVFTGCTNRSPRWLILDTLTFARETPAARLPAPESLGKLPFPTTPDGPLPPQLAGVFASRVERAPTGYRLVYEGRDGRLVYTFEPRLGTLDDVGATWWPLGADRPSQTLRPAADGGPVADLGGRTFGPPGLAGSRRCLSARLGGGRVVTRWLWQTPAGDVTYALCLGIKGKSLLVDVTSEGGRLSGWVAGRLGGVPDARFVAFPYWSYGLWDWGRDGGVAVAGRLFASGLVDWYRSAASVLSFDAPASHDPEALTPGALVYCPGVRYLPRSDGRRNDFRERFIYTVSPDVREALPSIPHSPSPNRQKLAEYAHYTGGQASQLDAQLRMWRRFHAYGADKVYIRHFDGMWADEPQGPQEWTLAEHAAPAVGDAAVRRYLDQLAAMGFLPVLYTNYTDLQPMAAEFDWDAVMRRPDGDIEVASWPGSYPLKPTAGLALEARYGPRIAARFGVKGSFCDVHTAVAPWHKVDYDARLPGAGQFSATYRCYTRLLLRERATYGAVYSEGSRHWLYAGLHDGSDAQISSPRPYLEPFLVDFDLLRIHPLEMDAGMSYLSRYIRDPIEGARKGNWQTAAADALGGWETALDRYNAATLAFGHQAAFTGMFVRGYEADLKAYYMIQPVQKLYAMRRAEDIRYRDPDTGAMLDASAAILSGAYRESQVHVRYETGLEVWVNGSLKRPWTVTAGGATHELPPNGWVCARPGPVVSWSATVEGARADYCRSAEARFADARGVRRRIGEFDTDGAVIARKTEGGWAIFPLGTVTALTVDAGALGLGDGRLTATLRDEDGEVTGTRDLTPDAGLVALPLEGGVLRMDLAPAS
jgi:hypothetical protein